VKTVTSQEIRELVYETATTAGFEHDVAEALADATTQAEIYGRSTVGLEHLFYYFRAAKNGLINVRPRISVQPMAGALLVVDADDGPMQYAYRQSETILIDTARQQGIAALLINNAFAGGELGYFARRLAQQGLVSLAFANNPAVMSIGGSPDRLLGTNPISYGIPLDDERAIVIDQATSSTARVNFQKYAQQQEPIPEGWELDRHGQPTTSAAAALDGVLLPFGGYKGGNIALLVEFLAMLGGANSSYTAAPYYAGQRKQGIGATILAVDAQKLPGYSQRIDELAHQYRQDHGSLIRITQLQGSHRNIEVSKSLWSQLQRYARHGTDTVDDTP